MATETEKKIVAYRFDDFRLLAQQQRLERAGSPVALTTKLYHLLLIFLSKPGEILTKDEIVNAVWPGQVVTDAALTKQMQRLRQLIGDADRANQFLETHRGLGYRFTGEVTLEYPEAPSAPVPPRQFSWHMALPIAAAGAALTLAIFINGNQEQVSDMTSPGVAVLPVAAEASLLSKGAAEFIASNLSSAADVAPALQTDEDPARATQSAGLSLATRRAGPVVAVQLRHDTDAFKLWLNLRTAAGVASVVLEEASMALLLKQAAQWIAANTDGQPGVPLTNDNYAVDSYFEGLAVANSSCDRAIEYYRAALNSDPGFALARLGLADCERQRGNAHEAAAIATALASRTDSDTDITLEARFIAARAHIELGDNESARQNLEIARTLTTENQLPLEKLSALSVLALLANIDGDVAGARSLHEERLQIALRDYPLPRYLSQIHLDIAASALNEGDSSLVATHAQSARSIAEENGDLETLVRSYHYLIASYYENNDLDAAVQLALTARPTLDRVSALEAKAFFMQFAALSLTARGRFTESREYTDDLRNLARNSANPIIAVLADFTVMHRVYVKGDFEQARLLAANTRAGLETTGSDHSAIPEAMAIEALAASRGAPIDEAEEVLRVYNERYGDIESLRGQYLRARGHLLVRQGEVVAGIAALRQAEEAYRATGLGNVADYVVLELIEVRLDHTDEPPWDDLNRMSLRLDFDYKLSRLLAQAHALEDNNLAAITALEEARLRGNELWSEADQLLLERYRSSLAVVNPQDADGNSLR